MSALTIIVALHHIVTCEPWKSNSPAYRECVQQLVNANILMPSPEEDGGYSGTPRGWAWKELICATPLPTQQWVDPRDKSIIGRFR